MTPDRTIHRTPGGPRPARAAALAAVLAALAWFPSPAAAQGIDTNTLARSREEARARGEAALQDRHFPLAERYFSEFMTLAAGDEERLDAGLLLAQALLEQKKAVEAMDLLQRVRRAADASPKLPLWRFWFGRALLDGGRPADALKVVDEALDAKPDPDRTAGLMLLRAQALFQAGRLKESADTMLAYAERFGDRREAPDAIADWAGAVVQSDREGASIPVLEKLIQRFPDTSAARKGRYWLAGLWMDRREGDKALALLQRLAEDRNGPAEERIRAWLLIAQEYENRNAPQESMIALDAAEGLKPSESLLNEILLHRVRALLQFGELDRAAALLPGVLQKLPGDPRAAAAQLDFAQRLLDKERFDAAEKEFQRYLEAFPDPADRAQALMGRGWSLLGLKRHAEAATIFEKAADATRDGERRQRALFKAGDAYLLAGQFQSAEQKFDAVLTSYPDSSLAPDALFQRAECLVRLQRSDEATALLTRIGERWPDHPLAERAVLRRLDLDAAAGRDADALAGYARYFNDFPGGRLRPAAHVNRGALNYRLGRLQDALADFSAVTADAGADLHAKALYLQAWTLRRLGEAERAAQIAADLIRRAPNSPYAPEVRFFLAETAFNRGDNADAERRFAALAAAHPGSPLADRALLWAGRAAAAAKEFLRAVDYFGRLAKLYPKSDILPEARFSQGDALTELGRFPEAVLAFEEVTKNFPDSQAALLAWGRLGDCHFTLGGSGDTNRLEKSVLCYETVLKNPSSTPALRMQAEYKIGRGRETLGRTEEAFENYMNVVYAHLQERAAGRTGGELWFARAAFAAAAIKEREGRPDEASTVYARVIEAGGAAAAEAAERRQKLTSSPKTTP